MHHLPAVGTNLQDHLFAPVSLDVSDGAALDILSALSPTSVLQVKFPAPALAPVL